MKITRHKIDALRKNDLILGQLIDELGLLTSPVRDDNHLRNASRIIVDQQISYKAAKAIWNKLDALVGDWQPSRINEIDVQHMRAAGLSAQKAHYIKSLALSIHEESFSFDRLKDLDDDEATRQLISIKGYGRWSAAMFLMFSLGREDIFSPDDAGLKRTVMNIYGLDEQAYLDNIDSIAQQWSPYRSIASLYLWAKHD